VRAAAALLLVASACAAPRGGREGGTPILFEGLVEARARDLRFAARRELSEFEARGRRDADLEDAAYAMELALREGGFAHASVAFRREPERVVFVVHEGPRVVLDGIEFPGAAAFSRKELEARFERPRRRLFADKEEAWFRLARVEAGVRDLERAYLLAGYHRVRVGPPRVFWSEDRARARVEVPVEEGPRFTVAQVEVEGAPEEEAAEARAALLGAPYHVRRPYEAAARIRGRLLAAGHQSAEVSAEAELDEASATAKVTLRVAPGPVFRARAIEIAGHDRTKERFIRSRVPLRPGEVLSQDRIDEGIDALHATGIFRSVRATVEELEDHEASLRIAVEELLARSVSFEAGWGSYELARARVRYEDRNLFGLGRQLGAELLGSLKSYGALGSVSDAHLLGPSRTLRVGAGFQQREEPSFTRTGTRFDVAVEQRFPGPLRLTGAYVFDAQRARDVTGEVPGAEEGGFITSAGLGLALVRDTRDDRLLPSRGSAAEAGLFWSSPALGADLDFLELRASLTRHFRLSDRVVLAAGFRFTTREVLDDRPTLPIAQRLFLGGDASVRSFGQDELGPLGANGDPIGGLTAAEGHVELRIRVRRRLHVAPFYDVGTLAKRSFELPGPPGHAVGVGLRYYLPVGPARLDVGYNPGRLFGASARIAVHFGFGFTF